jgi:hypothetical protein
VVVAVVTSGGDKEEELRTHWGEWGRGIAWGELVYWNPGALQVPEELLMVVGADWRGGHGLQTRGPLPVRVQVCAQCARVCLCGFVHSCVCVIRNCLCPCISEAIECAHIFSKFLVCVVVPGVCVLLYLVQQIFMMEQRLKVYRRLCK